MLSRRQFLVLVGSAGVAAGGMVLGVAALPGDSSENKSGPPEIRYGESRCDTCGMVIADVRHAAAWRDGTGETRLFDDIGCMIKKMGEEPPGPGTTHYVHDYADESWLEATAASFAVAPSIKGPMAYGIAALATRSAAEQLAKTHDGRVFSWDETVESQQL